MGSEIVERLREHSGYLRAMDESTHTEIVVQCMTAMEEAAARITALEAMCEKMAEALERIVSTTTGRDTDTMDDQVLRAFLAHEIARETLVQYREADNERHLRISEEQSEALHNAQVASFDSFEPPLAIKEADNGR